MEANQDRRRGRFHRSRRGSDRRGPDRRVPPPPAAGRDQVNVEQIMREIRSRVAERQGVELTAEQIQDLAARRLESILDPRSIRPSLLESLRRSAGASAPSAAAKMSSEPVYTFDDTTIYDSHRAVLRFVRKLLNPLLKLFFNPNPLIRAMHLQARLNVEAAEREAERDRRQAEWNALHYEVLQRLVTEVARVSLESQALSTRIESLDARVDFSDRRVRSLEAGPLQGRAGARPEEAQAGAAQEGGAAPDTPGEREGPDAARRRRRRRRGRRPAVPQEGGSAAATESTPPELRDRAAPETSSPPEDSVAEPVGETRTAATVQSAVPAVPQDDERTRGAASLPVETSSAQPPTNPPSAAPAVPTARDGGGEEDREQ